MWARREAQMSTKALSKSQAAIQGTAAVHAGSGERMHGNIRATTQHALHS